MKAGQLSCNHCIFGLCVENCSCKNCELGEGMLRVVTGNTYQKEAM